MVIWFTSENRGNQDYGAPKMWWILKSVELITDEWSVC